MGRRELELRGPQPENPRRSLFPIHLVSLRAGRDNFYQYAAVNKLNELITRERALIEKNDERFDRFLKSFFTIYANQLPISADPEEEKKAFEDGVIFADSLFLKHSEIIGVSPAELIKEPTDREVISSDELVITAIEDAMQFAKDNDIPFLRFSDDESVVNLAEIARRKLTTIAEMEGEDSSLADTILNASIFHRAPASFLVGTLTTNFYYKYYEEFKLFEEEIGPDPKD